VQQADPATHLRVSLRVRLTVAFAVAMLIVLLSLGAFVYLRLQKQLLYGIDRNLRSAAQVFSPTVAASRLDAATDGRLLVDPDEAFAQVLDRSGRILDSSAAVRGAPLLPADIVHSVTEPKLLTRPVAAIGEPARLLAVPTTVAGRPAVVVLGETLGDRADALHQFLVLYAIAGSAALLVASGGGWLLAGAALRPVERIRRQAESISHADAHARLPVPGTGDELSRLAATLNDLLARMHAALEREHRFVDYASHELRTPLAILKAELDLAASRPRSIEELTATLQAAARETDRLVDLARDLLVLSRVRGGQLPVSRTAVDLRQLLEEAVAPLRNRAQEEGVGIDVIAEDSTVRCDPVRVRQAVHNLVENALEHGRGRVVVSAERMAGRLSILVADRGPGFPAGSLDTVFEPFTRWRPAAAEPAHPAVASPGSGLGLAIVRAVAAAHGGIAQAGNDPAGGAWVRIELETGDVATTAQVTGRRSPGAGARPR